MDIVYTFGKKLGTGIGLTAQKTIDPIKKAGYLKQLITGDDIDIQSNDGILHNNTFDVLASIRIKPPCDIYHGWGHFCYSCLIKSHNLGAKTIVERASSSILNQNRILTEEFKRLGLNSQPIHPWSIKKQLAEYKETDYVTLPSKYAYDTFIDEGYPREKIFLNPYGVDVEKFKPVKTEKDEKFRALFIGDNWIRKNLYDAEKAWSDLNLKKAEFIIRCNAPKFPDINYDTIKRVNWFDDIVETYNRADVFIMPSLEEGNALVIGESGSCGTPSITTYNSGTWFEPDKSCFFVPIHDIKALKEAIKYCYDNLDELKKVGKNARKKCEENTWGHYGKKLISNYRKIAE